MLYSIYHDICIIHIIYIFQYTFYYFNLYICIDTISLYIYIHILIQCIYRYYSVNG